MRTPKLLNLAIIIYLFFNSYGAFSQENKPNCISKVKSEWGENCSGCQNSTNSYRAFFVNTCDKSMDVKIAIQEKSLRWKTYTMMNVAPQDTISGYACEGTGKFMSWHRRVGDKGSLFPSDDEINRDYK
ncbi:MAG: hypothetical protein ACK5C5_05660 [Bacteroidota bacterium]|jgi:hypothetical protein